MEELVGGGSVINGATPSCFKVPRVLIERWPNKMLTLKGGKCSSKALCRSEKNVSFMACTLYYDIKYNSSFNIYQVRQNTIPGKVLTWPKLSW